MMERKQNYEDWRLACGREEDPEPEGKKKEVRGHLENLLLWPLPR